MWQYNQTPSTELYHHGILGQKWGKRNGPPYPLDGSDHSSSERKAGWRKSLSGGNSAKDSDKKKQIKSRSDYKTKGDTALITHLPGAIVKKGSDVVSIILKTYNAQQGDSYDVQKVTDKIKDKINELVNDLSIEKDIQGSYFMIREQKKKEIGVAKAMNENPKNPKMMVVQSKETGTSKLIPVDKRNAKKQALCYYDKNKYKVIYKP